MWRRSDEPSPIHPSYEFSAENSTRDDRRSLPTTPRYAPLLRSYSAQAYPLKGSE